MSSLLTGPQLYSVTDPASLQHVGGLAYCDTCAIIHVMGNPVSKQEIRAQQEMKQFMIDLARNEVVLCISSITSMDIRGALFNRRLRCVRSNMSPMPDKLDIMIGQPGFSSSVVRDIHAIERSIAGNPNFLFLPCEPGDDEFAQAVDAAMVQHNLNYLDACHYVVMQNEGIRDILTTDRDFSLVQDPTLRIFTTSDMFTKIWSKLGVPPRQP